MTLNDLERRNSSYFAFLRNSTDFQADYITVVKDRPIMSVKYCLPFHSAFGENYNAPCSAVSACAIAEHLVSYNVAKMFPRIVIIINDCNNNRIVLTEIKMVSNKFSMS